jgi:hypothetical protein
MGPSVFETTCQPFRVKRQDKTSSYTSMLLTGGKYNFCENTELQRGNSPKDGLNRNQFIDLYYERYQKMPSIAEFAMTVLYWWWCHRQSPTEGVSLTSKRSDPFFFMFFDVDLLYSIPQFSMERWEQEKMIISTLVLQNVACFFPDPETIEMTVATLLTYRQKTVNSPVKKEPMEMYKMGLHFYFPQLVVSFEEAIILLNSVKSSFRNCLGERDQLNGENTWDDVFDSAVYKNGLRDCYTFKTKSCNSCKTKCNPIFDRDSVYVPQLVMNLNNVTEINDQFYQDRGYVLGEYNTSLYNLTRIRCSDNEKEQFRRRFERKTVLAHYAPLVLEEDGEAPPAKRSKRGPASDFEFKDDINAVKKLRNFIVLYFSSDDLALVEETVRECFDEKRYGRVQIRTIYGILHKDKSQCVNLLGRATTLCKIKITLKGEGSKYCFNRGGEHTSNTAYFELVLGKGKQSPRLVQRCWSPHSYTSAGVLRCCDKFVSSHINKYGDVPNKVLKLLFHHPSALPIIDQNNESSKEDN